MPEERGVEHVLALVDVHGSELLANRFESGTCLNATTELRLCGEPRAEMHIQAVARLSFGRAVNRSSFLEVRENALKPHKARVLGHREGLDPRTRWSGPTLAPPLGIPGGGSGRQGWHDDALPYSKAGVSAKAKGKARAEAKSASASGSAEGPDTPTRVKKGTAAAYSRAYHQVRRAKGNGQDALIEAG